MGEKDDFVSLWKKKGENSQTSAVGGLLDKVNAKNAEVEELTKQNEELKEKIVKNIELLNQTETVIKTLKEKVLDLEENKRSSNEKLQMQVYELKLELEKTKKSLSEAEKFIQQKVYQIEELTSKVSTEESAAPIDAGDSSRKDAKIEEITGINRDLMQQIKDLKSEVASLKKPEPKEMPNGPFKTLVQDLQNKLNKSKKKFQTLIAENKQLKSGKTKVGAGGGDSERVAELESEKEVLLERISELETQTDSADSDLVKKLEAKIKEKDNLIKHLQSDVGGEAPAVPSGPVPTGLVDDLQNTIKILRAQIKKKDKIIADLRK